MADSQPSTSKHNESSISSECLTREGAIYKQTTYTGVIPEGLQKSKCIKIQGNTTESTERFSINLQTGPNHNPRDDIGLHISVDFQKKCIVRNSYQDGVWDEAEGPGRLPIQIRQNFDLIIYADSDHFKIGVNNKHYCDFFYRIPLNQLTHLVIDGNVSVNSISWHENCDTLYSSSVPTQTINQEQSTATSIQVTPSQSDFLSLNLVPETDLPELKEKMKKILLDEVAASSLHIRVLLNELMKTDETPTSFAQRSGSTAPLLENENEVGPESTQNQGHSFLKGNLKTIITVIFMIVITLTSVMQFYFKLSSGDAQPIDLSTLKLFGRHPVLQENRTTHLPLPK